VEQQQQQQQQQQESGGAGATNRQHASSAGHDSIIKTVKVVKQFFSRIKYTLTHIFGKKVPSAADDIVPLLTRRLCTVSSPPPTLNQS
jgi:hypothetical protein